MSKCQNMSDSLPFHSGNGGWNVSNPSRCAVSNPLHMNLIFRRQIIHQGTVACDFIILKEITLILFTLCWFLLYFWHSLTISQSSGILFSYLLFGEGDFFC